MTSVQVEDVSPSLACMRFNPEKDYHDLGRSQRYERLRMYAVVIFAMHRSNTGIC